jgi:hypothetical protein
MAEQPTLQPDTASSNPFGGDYDKHSRDTIVGGEAIGVARKIGASAEDQRDNPWLAAITTANGKDEKDVPTAERAKNITEIVAAAKAAGVPRDRLKDHLHSLGIATVDLPTDSAPKSGEAQPSAKVDHDIHRAYLTELKAQAGLALRGSLPVEKLKSLAEEALQKGVPRADVLQTLKDAGVDVQDEQTVKPPETKPTFDPSKPVDKSQYRALADRFNAMRVRITPDKYPVERARGDKAPIGKLLDAAWTGGDEESRKAYAEISALLDELDSIK